MTCWRALTRPRCYSEVRSNALEPRVFNLLLKVAIIGGVIAQRRISFERFGARWFQPFAKGWLCRSLHAEVWNAVGFADGVLYWLVLGPEASVCSWRAEQITAEAVTRNSNTGHPCLVIEPRGRQWQEIVIQGLHALSFEMSRISLIFVSICSYQCDNWYWYWNSLMAMIKRSIIRKILAQPYGYDQAQYHQKDTETALWLWSKSSICSYFWLWTSVVSVIIRLILV